MGGVFSGYHIKEDQTFCHEIWTTLFDCPAGTPIPTCLILYPYPLHNLTPSNIIIFTSSLWSWYLPKSPPAQRPCAMCHTPRGRQVGRPLARPVIPWQPINYHMVINSTGVQGVNSGGKGPSKKMRIPSTGLVYSLSWLCGTRTLWIVPSALSYRMK